MRKFSTPFSFALRRTTSSAPRRGRRLAVAGAAVAAIALVAGVLQTASASSVSQVLTPNTTTTLSGTPDPSVVGQEVTYTAKVEYNDPVDPLLGPTPPASGTVDFFEKKGAEDEKPLCQDQPVDPTTGEAECKWTHPDAGTRTIIARYSDDTPGSTYEASEDSEEQLVNKAATTTTLTSTGPSVVGETVTYTATVQADLPGTGTPGGQVVFSEGATVLCTKTLESGQATCDKTYHARGTHTIRATYQGGDNYEASPETADPSQTLIQTVTKALTSTRLAISDSTPVTGQPVTLTATVSVQAPGAGDPTGSVKFKEGSTIISGCDLAPLDAADRAQCDTRFMAEGSPYDIRAVYSGDEKFKPSDSPTISQTVARARTTTGLSSSRNPSPVGQSVTYTAVVLTTAPGTGFPDGTVWFKDGTETVANCNAVPLDRGEARCTATYNTVGDRTIKAVFRPRANYARSASDPLTQVVKHFYGLAAFISQGSGQDPSNASFKISTNGGAPARDYQLCIRLEEWPANVVTPQPKEGGSPWWLNARTPRCKSFKWNSGANSTRSLYPHYGFAARGNYVATWKINGEVVGERKVAWNSWCPPMGLRDNGVWRPSRHKPTDWCASGRGTVVKNGGIAFDHDRGSRWNSGIGSLHIEHVARDHYYSNPTTGSKDLIPRRSTGDVIVYWGKKLCDTYHGTMELHPVWMQQGSGGNIHITGPQYNPKTPSISGTWSTHGC